MIKKSFFIVLSLVFFYSCKQENEIKQEKKLPLNEIIDGKYTEYYPGRKHVKIQGHLDENEKRNGKWSFYGEDGKELSVTYYNHGLKEGHSIVKYPNGMIYYYGEYQNDQKVGVWKTYGTDGKLQKEEDFGSLE